MPKMQFHLVISAQQYLSYYQGTARFVSVRTDSGQTIKFPASELQRFVTHSGIQGRFEIEFSEQYKLVKLARVG